MIVIKHANTRTFRYSKEEKTFHGLEHVTTVKNEVVPTIAKQNYLYLTSEKTGIRKLFIDTGIFVLDEDCNPGTKYRYFDKEDGTELYVHLYKHPTPFI